MHPTGTFPYCNTGAQSSSTVLRSILVLKRNLVTKKTVMYILYYSYKNLVILVSYSDQYKDFIPVYLQIRSLIQGKEFNKGTKSGR